MKEDFPPSSHVPISNSKSILKSELLSLLKTYNCYHEGKSFQLRHREEEGALIIDGLLNISWGLRRPIRLQMQDDRERLHLPTTAWTSRQPSCDPKEPTPQNNSGGSAEEPGAEPLQRAESSTHSSEPLTEDTEVPQLLRTRSDASCVIQRRPKGRTPGEAQRVRQHRFSINGHFYNHKTSVFTPGFGSITNVRVNSTMTTLQVLTLLLSKFRVENGPEEFALYMVHESGGKCLAVFMDPEIECLCPLSQPAPPPSHGSLGGPVLGGVGAWGSWSSLSWDTLFLHQECFSPSQTWELVSCLSEPTKMLWEVTSNFFNPSEWFSAQWVSVRSGGVQETI
nr:ras association domain-containing protein 4 isoform X2 [Loxodonta africana]